MSKIPDSPEHLLFRMVIPVIFGCVKNLAFWIEILDSSLMRIITVNCFIKCCIWPDRFELHFGMDCLNVVSFIVKHC